jgi:endonuclease III
MQESLHKISKTLLQNRSELDPNFWYWLKPNLQPSMKDANKFFLGCILDWQMRVEVAWENARRLAEDILGDPDRLWDEITSVKISDWMAKRSEYRLHRFPKGHERVWSIGDRIAREYGGDARNIWQNQSIDATLFRLNFLGVGEQISRMVVGALKDTGQITGKGDVKVDIHVRRVLGRALQGYEFSLQEKNRVIELTRQMHPENPWMLDRPLYLLGKQICEAGVPKCELCFLQQVCAYSNRRPNAS